MLMVKFLQTTAYSRLIDPFLQNRKMVVLIGCIQSDSCSCRLWDQSVVDALSPRPEWWTHPVITDTFWHDLLYPENLPLPADVPSPAPSVASVCSDEIFDWTVEEANPIIANLRELMLGNISPESLVYIRSHIVSPIELDMNLEQAMAGEYALTTDKCC